MQEQTEIKEALTSKSAQRDRLKKEEANAIGLYEEKKQKEERQQAELKERARLRSSLPVSYTHLRELPRKWNW